MRPGEWWAAARQVASFCVEVALLGAFLLVLYVVLPLLLMGPRP